MWFNRIFIVELQMQMISAYCLVFLFFSLAPLTAVLALEEVDWAGVGGQDQHHLVALLPLHL